MKHAQTARGNEDACAEDKQRAVWQEANMKDKSRQTRSATTRCYAEDVLRHDAWGTRPPARDMSLSYADAAAPREELAPLELKGTREETQRARCFSARAHERL